MSYNTFCSCNTGCLYFSETRHGLRTYILNITRSIKSQIQPMPSTHNISLLWPAHYLEEENIIHLTEWMMQFRRMEASQIMALWRKMIRTEFNRCSFHLHQHRNFNKIHIKSLVHWWFKWGAKHRYTFMPILWRLWRIANWYHLNLWKSSPPTTWYWKGAINGWQHIWTIIDSI